jgi:phosphoribosylformylglycinamidine cyclo-ligase
VLVYLAATGSPVGMLYNFGQSSLEFRRVLRSKNVQDWQKYLYRVMWAPPGTILPPENSLESPLSLQFSVTSSASFRDSVTKSVESSVPLRDSATESVDSSIPLRDSATESVDSSVPLRDSAKKSVDSYASSGVSIDAGNRAVELMKSAVQSTYTPAVLAGIGSFGGLFDASALKEMTNPVLVASTDGVGTKVKLAAQLGRYRGIGHDIVNHCIDDILVQGARPLFFMDYFATSKLNPEQTAEVVTGIAEACKESGIALLGGETAEMPGVYAPGEFDVAGTIVGVLERDRILPRTSELKAGDVLIGLRSSGPHTNGYSLIRKVFADADLTSIYPEWGVSLADMLLAPHRSYLKVLEAALRTPHIRALAHLTGGGFVENIPRILPDHLDAEIQLGSWDKSPLWDLIQHKGNIPTEEMYRVFNMGIGMVVVVDETVVSDIQKQIPEQTFVIGKLIPGSGKTLLVP